MWREKKEKVDLGRPHLGFLFNLWLKKVVLLRAWIVLSDGYNWVEFVALGKLKKQV